MIVTHKQAFTIQKLLYKIKQLSHNFKKLKLKPSAKAIVLGWLG